MCTWKTLDRGHAQVSGFSIALEPDDDIPNDLIVQKAANRYTDHVASSVGETWSILLAQWLR